MLQIFNFYIENSFAAFPGSKVWPPFFDMLLETTIGFPFHIVENDEGKVIGFGLLRSHNRMDSFQHTAELSYSIAPGFTGKGIGSRLLETLEEDATKMGIHVLLASISSLNPESIGFHRKHGFTECGKFHGAGRRRGRDFDLVWMQKHLKKG